MQDRVCGLLQDLIHTGVAWAEWSDFVCCLAGSVGTIALVCRLICDGAAYREVKQAFTNFI